MMIHSIQFLRSRFEGAHGTSSTFWELRVPEANTGHGTWRFCFAWSLTS